MRSSEDFLLGAGCEFAGGTGYGHFPVRRCHRLAALALQADRAAGGVQVDAGFLVGFVLVAGLADGEQRQAVLDGEAVVALGDEVGVVPCGDGEILAGGENLLFGGDQGDAGRGGELETGLGPGGDAARATLGGLDAVALPCVVGTMGGGGAHRRFGLFQAIDGGKLVGLRVALQVGVLLVGDIGQAVAEAVCSLGLGDGFAAVELGA